MRLSAICILTLLSAIKTVAFAQDRSNIRLAEIDDRFWLIDPHGSPFFAHGITIQSPPNERQNNSPLRSMKSWTADLR